MSRSKMLEDAASTAFGHTIVADWHLNHSSHWWNTYPTAQKHWQRRSLERQHQYQHQSTSPTSGQCQFLKYHHTRQDTSSPKPESCNLLLQRHNLLRELRNHSIKPTYNVHLHASILPKLTIQTQNPQLDTRLYTQATAKLTDQQNHELPEIITYVRFTSKEPAPGTSPPSTTRNFIESSGFSFTSSPSLRRFIFLEWA